MSTPQKCPQCGAPLPENAPGGLCPHCLMRLNLKTETVLTGESAAASPPPSPADLAPHFPQLEILECLGRGGMGVVYKARQPQLDRFVALKILAPERVTDSRFAERFLREAKTLARLNHPNIVTVHDFGQADGYFYLIMEFVDGVNLRELARGGRLSPKEALAIVPSICEALQYAHDRGIVHRDIKPENILLNKEGKVKIADFGIARLLAGGEETAATRHETGTAPGLTAEGVLGTPKYMAPEQAEKPGEVDHRADIYSLGVVFYEMLTGELPGKKIEPPSHKVQIDVRLDEVVLRALERKPELRYQQASEVKTQVEAIATGGTTKFAEPKQQSESSTRLSGAAMVGACLAPFFFISMFFWDFGGLGGAIALRGLLLSSLGFIAVIGTTVLGWVSVGQIRRSEGRLDGMWLAVFDGLMLPVLIVDILILFVLLFANKFLNIYVLSAWYPGLRDSMWVTLPGFLVWLLVTTAVVVGIDYAIIRRVWRAVNAAPNRSPAYRGSRRRVHMAVATIIFVTFVAIALAAGYRHANKADYFGQSFFPHGDFIKIYSVQRSKDRMIVTGAYNLASRASATLALYITTTNNMAVPTGPQQEIRITNGWGNFELIDTNLVPGLPHISMYSDHVSGPFASLYFGTRTEANEERHASWITNAAPAATTEAEAERIRKQVEQQARASAFKAGKSAKSNLPKAILVTPADGATNVSARQEIRIRFDASMNPDDVSLQWLQGGFQLDGWPRYDRGENEFVIPVWLAPGQTNELAVNLGSSDFGGFRGTNSSLAQEYRWHFTTQTPEPVAGAVRPKAVQVSPARGETLPVLTLFQITFDQPMMPPVQSPPYLRTTGWGGWGLPALIAEFEYDAASRTFTVPVLLPPDNETRLTLEGFRGATGLSAEPVVISCQIGTNNYSIAERDKTAAAAEDPQLKQLLFSMKIARSRLSSGVETVQALSLFGQKDSLETKISSQWATFKWQGTNQFCADLTDVMGMTRAFILGSDGTTCWLYSEDERIGQRLNSAPVEAVADIYTSIADPFGLTGCDVATAIAKARLVYEGQEQLAGRLCYRVRSWVVRQSKDEPSGVSSSRMEWWIDANTFLPLQVVQCSTFGREMFRFDYQHLNQSLPAADFQPPVRPGNELKSDHWFTRELGPEEKRFLTIKDGCDGRMSGRLGVSGPGGTTSSGLN